MKAGGRGGGGANIFVFQHKTKVVLRIPIFPNQSTTTVFVQKIVTHKTNENNKKLVFEIGMFSLFRFQIGVSKIFLGEF